MLENGANYWNSLPIQLFLSLTVFLALLRRKAIVICFYSLVLFVVMFIIVLRLKLIQFKNISFPQGARCFLLFFSSLAIEVSCHESDLKKVQLRIWMSKKEIKNRYEKHSLLILTELGILGNIYINMVPKREILSCNFLPDILLLPLLFHIAPSYSYFSLQTNLKLLFSIIWRYFSFEISIPLLYLC